MGSDLSYEGSSFSAFERRGYRKDAVRRLAGDPTGSASLHSLFGEASDRNWFWLLTEGRRELPELAQRLPLLPAEEMQAAYTGLSGDIALEAAVRAVSLFLRCARQQGLDCSVPNARLLDFGCGWGRITQAFLRDFEPSCIVGVDVSEESLAMCRDSGLQCELLGVDAFPPVDVTSDSIDLVSAFSVFSHLSEEAHWAWVEELHRVLRPGGVMTVTTRPREFIDHVVHLRLQPDIPDFALGAAASFVDADASYALYDAGDFCFDVKGSGGDGRVGYYGEALIPRGYVEREWTKLFSAVDFVDHKEHGCFDQNLIVARK